MAEIPETWWNIIFHWDKIKEQRKSHMEFNLWMRNLMKKKQLEWK